MGRGRRPAGVGLVEKLKGSAEAKQRLDGSVTFMFGDATMPKGAERRGEEVVSRIAKGANRNDDIQACKAAAVEALAEMQQKAKAAGADAVVIPERRASGITETVAKAAAGALEYLPVVRVTNITRALEELKKAGFWIYGLDERGDQDYDGVDFSERVVLVFGAEGKGLHQLVRNHCDVLVRIPMAGKISSLNVSVAAGIVLFEWKRRRAAH